MFCNKKASHKLVRAKLNFKSKKKLKAFKAITFIMPIVIVSVLVFGIVQPVYKLNKQDAVPTFVQNSSDHVSASDSKKLLILVNQERSLPSSYTPDITTFNDIKCDKIMVDNLAKMFNDAENQKIHLKLSNGYVDKDEQKKIYENEVNRLCNKNGISVTKAKIEVDKYLSPPNKDEHQTGLGINILSNDDNNQDFTLTPEYNWLQRNCFNYGFVLRYPENKVSVTKKSFDSTLYRYVGVSNAQKMRMMDMCLDEYVLYINER